MFSFFSKYAKAFKYGAIVLVLVCTAFLGFRYATVLEENERLSQRNTQLSVAIEDMEARLASERKQSQELQNKNKELDALFNKTVRQLQQAKKDGQELLNREPDIMGKKIQDSFNDIQARIECATGERTRCKKP